MRLSGLCIARPVATILLTVGVVLAGIGAFLLLPVAPLPQVDNPTITVQASLPGASPETMATAVATPLERHLGTIADVSEMSSSSSTGSTSVTLQFGINRDIDGAARDVQAAIVAARADLPSNLRSPPTYRKVNPADAPIMLLSLTSRSRDPGRIYDAAATVLQQKLSQVPGIGQVVIGGSSLPSVLVELDPRALAAHGIGMEDVRAALASANANAPKGVIEADGRRWQLSTNDKSRKAEEYRALVIAWRNGAAVRVGDVATVSDSVEDQRNQGYDDGEPAVLLILFRQPGANIIATVDRVRSMMPELQASIPPDITVSPVMDRTTTIRASLRDVERTLAISIALVVLVVWVFLRNVRLTLIPCVVVPVSLLGTCGVMWLCGFSINNLSLMALIVATGFVVDDAIVVLENAARHVEAGMAPMRAALRSAREVGFTVVSMSLSLVAVFIPVMLMGGYVGRLFHEFAWVLTIAILISMAISLTVTPMMCGRLLRGRMVGAGSDGGRAWGVFARVYARSLTVVLRHPFLTLLVLGATIAMNVWLFIAIPKGFFPQQDTGRLMGNVQADQAISFPAMATKLAAFLRIVREDPAVTRVVGFTGGGSTNSARLFAVLKPVAERDASADVIAARLRKRFSQVVGADLFLQSPQDIRTGGRMGSAQWQYTLQSDNLDDLRRWTPRLVEALKAETALIDVNSDQQEKGQELRVTINRDAAARLHLTPAQIDNTLYDAFGQRQVSTIYNPLNQYHVVMSVKPEFRRDAQSLRDVRISTAGGTLNGSQATNAIAATLAAGKARGADPVVNQRANQIGSAGRGSNTGSAVSTVAETMIPLPAVADIGIGTTALSVNHNGHFTSSTISFNIPPERSLSEAITAIGAAADRIGMPVGLRGEFSGTARTFQQTQNNLGWYIVAAICAIYIVLGILYESWMHPLTILSTLPSAGIGAVLALMLCGTDFTIIALIGVFLLLGIVKKNAIMMVDVALDLERRQGLDPAVAIWQACQLRLRPIIMTTLVAMVGSLPLALGRGDGAELRRPLGITIVGGLVVSQLLTLYTTPVVYLCLDRLGQWLRPGRHRRDPGLSPPASEASPC